MSFNPFPGAVATLAIAIALALPAPARSETSDVAKVIAGIAAMAIIAKAIDHDSGTKKSATVGAGRLAATRSYDGRSYDDRYDYGRYGRTIEGRIRPYDNHGGPKAGRGYKSEPLPDRCLRVVETGRRDHLAYGSDCLDHSFKFASKLPRGCETAVRTPRGFSAVYGARCLEREGWRVRTR